MPTKQHYQGLILGFICFVMVTAACGKADPKSTPKPTLTTEASPTPTWTPVPTSTPSPSPTSTFTSTPTQTPSLTPTLARQVIEATVVMPGVEIEIGASQENPFLPTVPPLIEPLPNATLTTPPFFGWITFESDHPSVEYVAGDWVKMQTERASRGQYHYAVSSDAQIRFLFMGQAIQIRYVGYQNGGIWEIVIDGEIRQTINSYSPEAVFASTSLLELPPGEHLLEIRSTDRSGPDSSGHMVGLDAIHVYQADPASIPTLATQTPSPSPQPAEFVQLQGAPTLRPTATDEPPAVAQITIVVAYDENANRSIDPAEGVRGIPVRLVEVGTNRVIAQAVTDETGYASLQAISTGGLRLVVPYFGAYWGVSTGVQEISLLIPPGHQPGLIP